MQLLLSAGVLLITATSVGATIVNRDEWQGSTQVCLYLTNAANWLGDGQNLCQTPGYCYNTLPTDLNKNVSSAGPAKGTTCFLYDAANCTGVQSAPIVYPGYGNLSAPAIDFDKRAQSWMCYNWCGYMGDTSSNSMTATSSASSKFSGVSISVTTTFGVSGIPSMIFSITPTTSSLSSTSTPTSTPPLSSAATTTSNQIDSVPSAVVLTHTYADSATVLTTLTFASTT